MIAMISPLVRRGTLIRVIVAAGVLSMASATLAQAPAANTRLADAAERNDTPAVRALLSQKSVDIDAPQPDGSTALLWAAHYDNQEMADQLIRAGANARAKNDLGVEPLFEAAQIGSPAMIERLLKAGADANATLYQANTALMLASRAGNPAAVKLLLAHGAKVDAKEGLHGQTALMWAAAEDHADVVKLLVEAGADMEAVSTHVRWLDEVQTTTIGTLYSRYPTGGLTPLIHAVRENAYDAVEALLTLGANPSKPTSEGITPLTIAAANAHWDLANLLIQKGADVNDGSIVQLAEMAAFPNFVRSFSNRPNTLDGLDVIKALLKRGGKPDARLTGAMPRGVLHPGQAPLSGPVDMTAFYRAAMAGDVTMMQVLFDAGADVNVVLKDGSTPLMAAASVGVVERGRANESAPTQEQRAAAIQFCLDHGANIDAVDLTGATALHRATTRNLDDVISYLASKGAKLDIKDKEDRTPLFIAQNFPTRTPTPIREATLALLEKLTGTPPASRAEQSTSP